MAPEDWVARGGSRRNHVACGRLSGQLAVWVHPAGKVVNQIVDVFDRTKEVIAAGTAAESEKARNLQNALDVFRRRIGFEDEIVIAARPAILVPKLIHTLQLGHDLIVPHFLAIGETGAKIQSISGTEFMILDRAE